MCWDIGYSASCPPFNTNPTSITNHHKSDKVDKMRNSDNSDKPYVLGRTQMAGALLVISDRSNKLYESAVNYHNVGKLSLENIKDKLHEIQSYLGAVYEMVQEYELNSS